MRRKSHYLIIFLLVFSFIFICVYFYLPVYVTSKIIPQIADSLELEEFSCDIRRIGLTGADTGPLQIGSGEHTAISVGSIHADYSLPGLYFGHIRKIVLNGITLYCRFRNGKFEIRGLDLEKFLARTSSEPAEEDGAPVSFGRIDIRNAVLVCERKETVYRVPFALEFVPQENNPNLLNCKLVLYPRGQELAVSAHADLIQKQVRLALDANAFQADPFADFTKSVPNLLISGEADIKGNSLLKLSPFEISSLSLSAEFRNHETAYQNFKLQKSPVRIELSTAGGENWKISVPSVSAVSPVPLKISDLNCAVKLMPDDIQSSGTFKLELFSSSGATGRNDEQTNTPDRGQTNGNFSVRLTKKDSGDKEKPLADFSVYALNTDIRVNGTAVKIPGVSLTGKLKQDAISGMNIDGAVEISDAGVAVSKLKIGGIRGIIPIKWPCEDSGRSGEISINALRWDAMDIGSAKGFIRQEKAGFSYEAVHYNRQIPGLRLNLKGDNTGIRFDAHHKTPSPLKLEQFLPDAKGGTIQGELFLNGSMIFGDNSGTRGALDSKIENVSLAFKEKDIEIEGVRLGLSLPDLFTFRSAAKQAFQFKKAAFGKLLLTDGHIEFQIESDRSVLIEKSSFKWCNGSVNAQSLRILPGIEDYELVLYCDRLNLGMLLEQLGAARAEGDGTVNGRIPLRFKNGKLIFNDGFLFSTPGDGGTIHVKEAEMLTAAIPKDTPEYTQIDLAGEALKDFEYQWAKLRLLTEGEDLKLQMQFDGRPANPLPFVYKKELGRFVRVEAGTPGSRFQGIRLDVNLTLPLDKMLHYKELFMQSR
jgi:hypothetical protein